MFFTAAAADDFRRRRDLRDLDCLSECVATERYAPKGTVRVAESRDVGLWRSDARKPEGSLLIVPRRLRATLATSVNPAPSASGGRRSAGSPTAAASSAEGESYRLRDAEVETSEPGRQPVPQAITLWTKFESPGNFKLKVLLSSTGALLFSAAFTHDSGAAVWN
jgi:hypothetical protein